MLNQPVLCILKIPLIQKPLDARSADSVHAIVMHHWGSGGRGVERGMVGVASGF